MDTLIKTFSGVFFTLILTFIGISLLSSSMDARNAQAYMSEAVAEISASNCSTSTINYYETQDTTVDSSYEFTVTNRTKSSTSEHYVATATLKYDFTIPLLGMSKEKVIVTQIR